MSNSNEELSFNKACQMKRLSEVSGHKRQALVFCTAMIVGSAFMLKHVDGCLSAIWWFTLTFNVCALAINVLDIVFPARKGAKDE